MLKTAQPKLCISDIWIEDLYCMLLQKATKAVQILSKRSDTNRGCNTDSLKEAKIGHFVRGKRTKEERRTEGKEWKKEQWLTMKTQW